MSDTDGRSERSQSFHNVGVVSGLAAGAWLGAAEAPNKLIAAVGLSPFLISLCMVFGVFAARWTLPTLLKGFQYIFTDMSSKKHLIIWAILAGGLWAIGNTLSIYAIADVGLATAFPLWNMNSLVGLFWGWLFFGELRGADLKTWGKVLGGAAAIVIGAVLLCFASNQSTSASPNAMKGVVAAIGAAFMWGTMYVTYRKAYVSGMNPLSFVTLFVFGELGAMFLLASCFFGGIAPLLSQIQANTSCLFWLFLGGFCWVVGDMFQHYATKYVGISRGIPLSNTNQLWGLAWGALVFGELAGGRSVSLLALAGSVVMIAGAAALSSASASEAEQYSFELAVMRECNRYGLDFDRIVKAHHGEDPLNQEAGARKWWDFAVVAVALAVFIWLAFLAKIPAVAMNYAWMAVLALGAMIMLVVAGFMLFKYTRFS